MNATGRYDRYFLETTPWVNVEYTCYPGSEVDNRVCLPHAIYILLYLQRHSIPFSHVVKVQVCSFSAPRILAHRVRIPVPQFFFIKSHHKPTMRLNTFASIAGLTSVVSAAFDLNRGGGVLKAPEGDSFATVAGTFIVPNLSGTNRLSIWVGIGDSLQQNYVLGGGIYYNSTLQSFSAYWPDPVTDTTSTVPVASGNSITVTITKAEAGGTVTLENTTQNKRTTQSLSAPAGVESSELTALAANWFVQAYQVVPGQLVQTPNFGTVSFTACSAITRNNVSVPIAGAGRYEIQGTSGQVSIEVSLQSAHSLFTDVLRYHDIEHRDLR
jgi:hypothetical protein